MRLETPHRSEKAGGWLITWFLVVIIAEVVFLNSVVRERGLFDYIGLDYRGSRAAGEAILEHGLGAAYDSSLLEDSQRQLYDRHTIESTRYGLPFYVVPAPYPPPFTLAFVPSTWLPPVQGFVAWTLFHAVVLTLYLLRVARVFGVPRPGWLIVAVAISFPAFINFIMGQLSVWLVVFFGEALIAFEQRRHLKSGAWLGLLVCKPQVLVLIVPALALARQWKVLLGMVVSVAVLIVPTLVFGGDWGSGFIQGIFDTAGSTGRVMNTFPSSMTNWRAFALNSARIYPSSIVWAFALVAMVATGIAGLLCSAGLRTTDRRQTGLAWLGLAAATCAFSWHAHVHQILLMAPPLFVVLSIWPHLTDTVVRILLGTSAMFVLAAFTLSVGEAHDILGGTLLGCLVAVTAICALVLHSQWFVRE
jgi:hypothetical protein